LEVAQVLLEGGAEYEEGVLRVGEEREFLKLGDLRVNLLVQEDSPCALWPGGDLVA
jgi:hypothetical protein